MVTYQIYDGRSRFFEVRVTLVMEGGSSDEEVSVIKMEGDEVRLFLLLFFCFKLKKIN